MDFFGGDGEGGAGHGVLVVFESEEELGGAAGEALEVVGVAGAGVGRKGDEGGAVVDGVDGGEGAKRFGGEVENVASEDVEHGRGEVIEGAGSDGSGNGGRVPKLGKKFFHGKAA